MGEICGVASDIDGTKIITGETKPSPEVQEADRLRAANGIALTLSSARTPDLLYDFLRPAEGLDLMYLGDNLNALSGGSQVVKSDTGEVLWEQLIPHTTGLEIAYSVGALCSSLDFDDAPKGLSMTELLHAIECGEHLTKDIPAMFVTFPKAKEDAMREALLGIKGIVQPALPSSTKIWTNFACRSAVIKRSAQRKP